MTDDWDSPVGNLKEHSKDNMKLFCFFSFFFGFFFSVDWMLLPL